MKIVSFGYFLPYDGVPHAGGEYYLRHVRALMESGHEVTLVAPATSENRIVTPPSGARVVLVEEDHSLRSHVSDFVAAQLRHAVLPPRFTSAVVRSNRVVAAVRSADLLEFQWMPAAALLAPLVRRAAVRPPAVCVVHDVVGQSLARLAAQRDGTPIKRALRKIRAVVGRVEERRYLRRMDLVLTFSAKDRSLLDSYGVSAEVVDPPLAESTTTVRRPNVAENRLLFVGAFDRAENRDAADWLLDEIWPLILRAHPDTSLDLVGANPTPSMKEAAAASDRIHVSGYVDDLKPYYARASAAVVPLRLGAGVKFKVVTAMLEGLPVITTSVGAEGILDEVEDLFVGIEDDADGFAQAVNRHLENSAASLERARSAQEAASARYGWEVFRARLESTYRSLDSR